MASGPAAPGPKPKPSRALLYAALAFVVFWFAYVQFFLPRPAEPARAQRHEPAGRVRLDRAGSARPRGLVLEVQGQAGLS